MKASTILGVAVAAGLTIISGATHRQFQTRAPSSRQAEEIATRFQSFPDQIGSWSLAAVNPLDDVEVKRLQCIGHLRATYIHEDTGEPANVLVLLGPPGPVSVHEPEVCYASRNYTVKHKRKAVALQSENGNTDALWMVTLHTNDVARSALRVYYGWSSSDRWTADTNPRMTYGGKPFLLKLQVVAESSVENEEQDTCRRFLKDLLPTVRRRLLLGEA